MFWIALFTCCVLILSSITFYLLMYVFSLPIYGSFPSSTIKVIERVPLVKTYIKQFNYCTLNNALNEAFRYFREPNEGFLIIRNDEEKEWIIRKITEGFYQQALQDGLIEILDYENPANPHERILRIRIKIVEPCR